MKHNSRHSSSMPARGVRVAEQLMHEIAVMIRAEVKDPRIGLITITGVDLTPDYAYATVYFTVLPSDDETVTRTTQGLQAASGFLRGQIGRRVRIHTTPELRFKHDPSVERGAEISSLISKANSVRAADSENDAVPVQTVPEAVPDEVVKKNL